MPVRRRLSCVSLKLATTQTSWRGTIARSGWPHLDHLSELDAPLGPRRRRPGGAHLGVLDLEIGQGEVGLHLAQAGFGAARSPSASLIVTWWIWLSASASAARDLDHTLARLIRRLCTRLPSLASACWTSLSV